MEQHSHIGKNIGKIRELLGIKQESLAAALKISQQTISKIEQTPQHNANTIDRIAHALGIPATIITEFNEQLIVSYLKGTDMPMHLRILEKTIELLNNALELEREKMQEMKKISASER